MSAARYAPDGERGLALEVHAAQVLPEREIDIRVDRGEPVATLTLPLASGWLYGQGLHDRGVISLSNEKRLYLWSYISQRISEKPALGWGFNGSRALPEESFEPFRGSENVMGTHPHNAVLQALVGSLLDLLARTAGARRVFECRPEPHDARQ